MIRRILFSRKEKLKLRERNTDYLKLIYLT